MRPAEATRSPGPDMGEPEWPAPGYAWYVVGVLTFAYLVAHVDRQILTLLIEPIRHDLNISDTQVSLLGGFAFAVFYTFVGLPIAWLADWRSRRVIIAVGVAFWSVMTAACGLARTFGQLFLARVGVGVGEAALTPAAYSLLTDYFPPHQLGRAMGVYVAGVSLGGGLALVMGGAVLALTAGLPQPVLPVVGAVKSWQVAFICVSLLGLPVVALMATVREPFRRGKIHQRETGGREKGTVSPVAALSFVTERWRIYLPLMAGFTVLALLKNAVLIWTPTLYIRSYGLTASSIAYAYGLFLIIFGPLGSIGGGLLADKLRQRGYIDAPLRIVIFASFLTAPVAAFMPVVPTAGLSLMLLAALTMLLFVIGSLVPTALQLVTPNRFRAQMAAFALFIVNLLGMGLGPTVVALMTDYVFRDDLALRYSLTIVAIVAAPMTGLIFWSGLRSYRFGASAAMNGADGRRAREA